MARAIPWYWLGRSNYSAAIPGVLHVRLIKDPELKVRELVKSHGMDSQSARDFIEREENDSRSYIRHYFEEAWANPALYDIVIDMGKVSPEDAVSLSPRSGRKSRLGGGSAEDPFGLRDIPLNEGHRLLVHDAQEAHP